MARSPQTSAGGRLVTAVKYALAAGFLGLVALVVAVAIAVGSLPDYDELAQRDDLGQMIRLRAVDGTLLVSMGPTFGRWLPYEEIPKTMRSAMIAVEDKRFRGHLGVDPIGMARSVKVRVESGRWKQGGSTITQQLARNIFLTNSRTFGRKVKEGIARARARAQVRQGPDPRAVPQPGLFRRRRLWHRRRQPDLLRPWRGTAEPGRGGDHRRAGQGAVELFADRRRRGRARPRRRSARLDGRERLRRAVGGGRRRPRRRSACSRRPSRTACAISPTGRCRSSTR